MQTEFQSHVAEKTTLVTRQYDEISPIGEKRYKSPELPTKAFMCGLLVGLENLEAVLVYL